MIAGESAQRRMNRQTQGLPFDIPQSQIQSAEGMNFFPAGRIEEGAIHVLPEPLNVVRVLADQPAGNMPYGALKRLEIARALATEPRVLLLDEPAAGCNAVETQEIDAVISKIATSGITVVLVEHDMKLVMKISNRIHVLDQGRTLAEGTAAQVRANPAVVKIYLGAHA